jgi:3-hydroxyacyl-[acyl-carrier-protein] dehydratase
LASTQTRDNSAAQASTIVATNGTATRHFASDYPAAQGHFPGNPIIPGAVLLREVVAAMVSADDLSRREIVWAKFHQPVRPGDTMEIRWAAAGNEIKFSCSIAGSDQPAMTGALRLPPP